MKEEIVTRITTEIIASLEKGVIPWQRPWKGGGLPRNFVTKKVYRGFNLCILDNKEFASRDWITFNQARDLGGTVKKGEHGTAILFWKWREKEEKGEKVKIPVIRYYTVFNVTQCEGLEIEATPQVAPVCDVSACDEVIGAYLKRDGTLTLEHGGARAFYAVEKDLVKLPPRESFHRAEGYFTTAYHELCHSTGHPKRLNRESLSKHASFGSEDYSKEELIAELGASFLAGHMGINIPEIKDNAAAYLGGWLKVLKESPRILIEAGSQAQKACDLILGHTFDEAEEGQKVTE